MTIALSRLSPPETGGAVYEERPLDDGAIGRYVGFDTAGVDDDTDVDGAAVVDAAAFVVSLCA